MKNTTFNHEDFEEVSVFTTKETCDCISAIANAISIGIKQNSPISDVTAYIEHWCNSNSMPDEVCDHMVNVAIATLTSLGYER